MRDKGLLLDWDGTLLDSYNAQETATREVLEAHGVSWSQARFMAYPTDWRAHYRAAGIPDRHLPAASAAYRRAYSRQRTRLRPRARDVLRRLSGAGVPLALVTSGPRERVMFELRHVGLEGVFLEIVTFDDVTEPKPSPEGVIQAIRRLGINPKESAAIGDTGADVLAAQAAGVRPIVIRSRYTAPPYKKDAIGSWRALEPVLCTEFLIEEGP